MSPGRRVGEVELGRRVGGRVRRLLHQHRRGGATVSIVNVVLFRSPFAVVLPTLSVARTKAVYLPSAGRTNA